MNFKWFCLVMLVFFLGGCAANIPANRIVERNGIAALISTDDHRVAYIKDHGNLDRICASRESDAVATDETAVSLGFSAATGQGEEVGEQSGRGELGLGGRSPLVLMSREFLYRACELSSNLNSDPQTTIEIYKMFLKSLENIALAPVQPETSSVSSSLPPYQITDIDSNSSGEDNDSGDDDNDSGDDDDNASGGDDDNDANGDDE